MKEVSLMTVEELREEVLRLRRQAREDALRLSREKEAGRRAFEKPPEPQMSTGR